MVSDYTTFGSLVLDTCSVNRQSLRVNFQFAEEIKSYQLFPKMSKISQCNCLNNNTNSHMPHEINVLRSVLKRLKSFSALT